MILTHRPLMGQDLIRTMHPKPDATDGEDQ